MTKSIDIFIEYEGPIADIVQETETLLGAQLQFVSADGEGWYEFRNSKVRMTLEHHEFAVGINGRCFLI